MFSFARMIVSSKFVIYTDKYKFVSVEGLPPASHWQVKGYTVIALPFLCLHGPLDQAGARPEYHKAGIKLIVSAFGETDRLTTSGADPTRTANSMAKFIKTQKLDGIDVDYEDLAAMNKGDGKAEAWGQSILTHAPLARWLSLNALKTVGSLIDWYNIQFYNQGLYGNCEGLPTKSGGSFPSSSLFEIHKHGVPLNQLCIVQAKKKGWNTGFMFPNANAAWLRATKGKAFR
ncbi:glycoside hydrolase [Ganoderma leucocontextum]|nr:glycoside hydrolase [Ganoderma leucocontextum]